MRRTAIAIVFGVVHLIGAAAHADRSLGPLINDYSWMSPGNPTFPTTPGWFQHATTGIWTFRATTANSPLSGRKWCTHGYSFWTAMNRDDTNLFVTCYDGTNRYPYVIPFTFAFSSSSPTLQLHPVAGTPQQFASTAIDKTLEPDSVSWSATDPDVLYGLVNKSGPPSLVPDSIFQINVTATDAGTCGSSNARYPWCIDMSSWLTKDMAGNYTTWLRHVQKSDDDKCFAGMIGNSSGNTDKFYFANRAAVGANFTTVIQAPQGQIHEVTLDKKCRYVVVDYQGSPWLDFWNVGPSITTLPSTPSSSIHGTNFVVTGHYDEGRNFWAQIDGEVSGADFFYWTAASPSGSTTTMPTPNWSSIGTYPPLLVSGDSTPPYYGVNIIRLHSTADAINGTASGDNWGAAEHVSLRGGAETKIAISSYGGTWNSTTGTAAAANPWSRCNVDYVPSSQTAVCDTGDDSLYCATDADCAAGTNMPAGMKCCNTSNTGCASADAGKCVMPWKAFQNEVYTADLNGTRFVRLTNTYAKGTGDTSADHVGSQPVVVSDILGRYLVFTSDYGQAQPAGSAIIEDTAIVKIPDIAAYPLVGTSGYSDNLTDGQILYHINNNGVVYFRNPQPTGGASITWNDGTSHSCAPQTWCALNASGVPWVGGIAHMSNANVTNDGIWGVGGDGNIYNFYGGTSGAPTLTHWTAPGNTFGCQAIGDLAAAGNPNNETGNNLFEVWVRCTDGRIAELYSQSGWNWLDHGRPSTSGGTSMDKTGYTAVSAPAAAASVALFGTGWGGSEVAVIESDGNVYVDGRLAGYSQVNGWTNLGNPTSSNNPPVALVGPPAIVYVSSLAEEMVFVHGTDGNLYVISRPASGSWGSWTSLGNLSVSSTCVLNGLTAGSDGTQAWVANRCSGLRGSDLVTYASDQIVTCTYSGGSSCSVQDTYSPGTGMLSVPRIGLSDSSHPKIFFQTAQENQTNATWYERYYDATPPFPQLPSWKVSSGTASWVNN